MATLAKLSSKNQITLPAKIVRGFPDIEYFDVGFGTTLLFCFKALAPQK